MNGIYMGVGETVVGFFALVGLAVVYYYTRLLVDRRFRERELRAKREGLH